MEKGKMTRGMEWREGRGTELGSTSRVKSLSRTFHKLRPSICLHRARAYTNVYLNTEGEPAVLRRAKAFAYTLEILPPVILDKELILGYPGCKPRSVTVKPEYHAAMLMEEIDRLDVREHDPYVITEREKREYKEGLGPYWKDKTVYDFWTKRCPDEIQQKVIGTGYADCSNMVLGAVMGHHMCPPFEDILRHGLLSFREEAEKNMGALDLSDPDDAGKEHFYMAMMIICDAIEKYAGRHGDMAMELACKEKDPARIEELKKMAEICRRVPREPARGFHEALQSFWFIQYLLHVEGTGPAISPGRFDQYMYPYYRKDIESGVLTRESAQELLECLWIKMTNVMWFNGEMDAYFFPGYVPFQNLAVGGLNRETGKDATNELSYLCIDALMETRTTQPTLSVILHKNSPQEFRLKVADLVALGLGHPSIFNFETLKTMAMSLGYSEKEAMDVGVMGCVEPVGAGVQYGHSGGSFLNAPMCLEFVFSDGVKRVPDQVGSGKRLGLATGDVADIQTFEEFKAQVMRQMAEQIRVAHIGDLYAEQVLAEYFPNPFQSLLTRDCLSIGKDVTQGAARINVGPAVDMLGLADLVDSLAVVKKLVFEEKKVSLEELSKAMAANFEGYEVLRQRLINEAPKYGNDVDEVDTLAVEVLDAFGAKVEEYRGFRGNHNMGLNAPASVNVPLGFTVGALPSGRRAAEPLSDGVSPAPGRDKEGPTAVIQSITKLNHCSLRLGTLANLWLSGDSLNHMAGKKIFGHLLEAFHEQGGHHLQVNSISKRILRKAQKEPEKYPTLMVRIAGYSAYFIDLSESLQEHIISRTEHSI